MPVFDNLPSSYPQTVYHEAQFGISTDDVVGFTDAQRLAEEMQFTFSVTNEATWLYKNYKYPRYRNFYGYAQVMSGAYVVKDVELIHINQEVLHWIENRMHLSNDINCAAEHVITQVISQSTKAEQENDTQLYIVPVRQRYTSIRFRLCPGLEANVALRWGTIAGRCSNVFDPPEKQGQPQPSDNQHGSPSGRSGSGQPEDPIDKSNNDGKKPSDGSKPEEPKPGTQAKATGQWYGLYSGLGGDGQPYSGREYALPGATENPPAPILSNVRQGTRDGYQRAEVIYKGGVVDNPTDYSSYTFEFRPS